MNQIHRRTETVKIVRQVRRVRVGAPVPHTGLHIVHRDGVGAVGMGDAADECKPIGHAGDFRNVLPNCVPGTLVLIGLKGPRTSALESGFRSQISWWAGAPNMKQKMHDLALPNVLAVSFLACSALSRSGSISPIEDNPPARSHSRRVTPSHNRAGFMSNESTAAPRTDGICLRPMHCLNVDQTVSTGDSRRR